MKKIAIVTRKMITGGVERALIAMLKQFNYEEVIVDLYLENLGGDLYDEIPREVNCYKIPTVTIGSALKYPVRALEKAWCKWKLKKNKYTYLEQNYFASRMLLPIKEEYDIAIAYHAPNTVPVFYVIDKMQAKKKILWIHGDVDINQGQHKLALEYHGKYNKVCCVAKSICDRFLEYHPEMEGSVEVFYNYIDIEALREKVNIGETYSDVFSGTRILTIGRLAKEKGYDLAIQSCKKLRDDGYRIRWYVCGEGSEREALEEMIHSYHLENDFILLGNQENPYRFVKDCDLYVQTSRTEGYCTTTNEARILCTPVVTTDVSGACEQFINGETGWIVSFDAEEITNTIERCLDNPSEMEKISKNLHKLKFQNNKDIDKLIEG